MITASGFSLVGRTALVTGAGSPDGIGYASAMLLGQHGARVAITSTTDRIFERRTQLEKAGIESAAFTADLTLESEAHGVVEGAIDALGSIDILVNSAGMTSVSAPGTSEAGDLPGMSLDAWRTALARNLDTAFLLIRASLPPMVERGWGRIINIASVTGPLMAMRHEPAYAAAKAGLVGLTRSVALDYARHGVTANAIAPGWIGTASQTDHEAEQGLATPAGRSGAPVEIAGAVAWLASPLAGYITGQCITIDGGNAIAEERG